MEWVWLVEWSRCGVWSGCINGCEHFACTVYVWIVVTCTVYGWIVVTCGVLCMGGLL